jgi:hypothetical protein
MYIVGSGCQINRLAYSGRWHDSGGWIPVIRERVTVAVVQVSMGRGAWEKERERKNKRKGM